MNTHRNNLRRSSAIRWLNATVVACLLSFSTPLANSAWGLQTSPAPIHRTAKLEQVRAGQSDDVLTPDGSQAQKKYKFEDIEELLGLLKSKKFLTRENATEELSRLGEQAIKPLAIHFFRGSAESNWRIKRVLEAISTGGDEAVFLKAAGILQLLYGNQNEDIQKQIIDLQKKWRISRRAEAMQALVRKGYQVENTGVNYAGLRNPAGVIYIDNLNGVDEKSKAQEPPKTRRVNPHKDRRATILKIEKILAGSIDENRRTILSAPVTAAPNSNDPMSQLLSDRVRLGVAQQNRQLSALSIETPANWKPDTETLKLLRDVMPISQLTIQEIKVEQSHLDFLSELTELAALTMKGCEFEKTALQKFTIPKSVSMVSLAKMKLNPTLVKKLAQIQSLGLNGCSIDDSLLESLDKLKRVRSVAFENIEFSKANFYKLMQRPQLGYATFSNCKFDLDWVHDFQSKRPELTIEGAAKSFLGVQGPTAVTLDGMTGCQISRVIPDSAAARGGMEVNDVIIGLDDQDVDRFADVRLLIAQKAPGEKSVITVLRGKKKVKLNVVLGDIDTAPDE